MRKADPSFRRRPTPCVELVLRLRDGSPWRLTLSTGIERFIGHYPLVEGFDAGGPLVSFRVADSA